MRAGYVTAAAVAATLTNAGVAVTLYVRAARARARVVAADRAAAAARVAEREQETATLEAAGMRRKSIAYTPNHVADAYDALRRESMRPGGAVVKVRRRELAVLLGGFETQTRALSTLARAAAAESPT